MKASELIIELAKLIDKHGDVDVTYDDYGVDMSVENVEYYEDTRKNYQHIEHQYKIIRLF